MSKSHKNVNKKLPPKSGFSIAYEHKLYDGEQEVPHVKKRKGIEDEVGRNHFLYFFNDFHYRHGNRSLGIPKSSCELDKPKM